MPLGISRGHNKRDGTATAAGEMRPRPVDTEGEAFYETLFRTLPQNLVVWRVIRDKRGKPRDLVFVAITDALVHVFGFADPIGRSPGDFDPHFRDRDPNVLEICARVTGTGIAETHQGYYPALGKWFEIHVSRLTDEQVLASVQDVTEHRRTEVALQRLAYSLDHMDDYPSWTDSDGRIIEVSESTCRHLEYTRDELLAMTVFDICPDIDRDGWTESWRQAKQSGTLRIKARHRTKSGRFFPVEITVNSLVFDGQEYHCSFCRDISDRVQMEGSLHLTQSSVDNAPDMIYWLEPDGRLVFANHACSKLLGYSAEELQGMHIWDIDPSLTSESWHLEWARVKRAGPTQHEEVFRDKDGKEHKVEISSTHVQHGGTEYGVTVARDVTERKRIEESLLLTQLSVENAPDMIHWIDSAGRMTYANRSTCEFLGYSLEELQKMYIWDLSPGLTPEIFKERWQETAGTDIRLAEETWRAKDGREHCVEISATSVWQGERLLALAFVRDISERKRLEQRLQLLRYSLDRSDDYPLWTNAEGRIVEVSASTCRHLEYTRDELLNMTLFDIDPTLTPEAWSQNLSRKRVHGAVVVEGPHRTKTGRLFPVEVSISMFTFDGVEYGCAFCRDITERKKAEESLLLTQLSVDAAADMIHWTDTEGRLVYVNQSLLDCLGYSREELLSLHVWDIVNGLSPELLLSRAEQARGGVSFRREGALRAKNGRLVPMEVSSRWVELNGRLLAVSTNRDISERMEMLHTLLERDEQLRQSQKMEAVGRLAGGIAHDFNNVLTTIIGYSDLLLASPECPPGSIAEDISEIKAAAERAGALTRRILAFSRRQAMQPAVMSLNTVVSDTERLLARTIGADIDLRTSLCLSLGDVEIDEHQFVQVLLNLAVNARDAMPKGGTLTLETANVDLDEKFCETHPEAHPGPYVTLTVSDTGTGMDPEVLLHVFEPFYTTKPPGQGTGLGLATVYGIVAQSGGCTYVQSEPGQGTTFTVYLPRIDTPTESDQTDLASPEAEANDQTIMVVDSDALFLALATRVLERRGYRVLPFSDGEQAVSTLADPSIRVDVLLTDLALCGTMQGEQLAELAVKKWPDRPVLFMSTQARDTMVEAGRLDQGATYLEKPFTAEELARRVRTCLTETSNSRPTAGATNNRGRKT